MQTFSPDIAATAPVIQSYGPAGFRIANTDYPSSILVTPNGVHPIELTHLDALSIEHFAPLFAHQPPLEVLLIGTGATHLMVPPALRNALKAEGLPADGMNTGAAARTFNILLTEERRVAALLIKP